jgi:hypothetical protein
MIRAAHQKPLALLSRRVNHPNAATDNLHLDCRALLILIVAPYRVALDLRVQAVK